MRGVNGHGSRVTWPTRGGSTLFICGIPCAASSSAKSAGALAGVSPNQASRATILAVAIEGTGLVSRRLGIASRPGVPGGPGLAVPGTARVPARPSRTPHRPCPGRRVVIANPERDSQS